VEKSGFRMVFKKLVLPETSETKISDVSAPIGFWNKPQHPKCLGWLL
jgi:hypothetical protein